MNIYYAHFKNSNKEIIGWYSRDIHGSLLESGDWDTNNIPTPNLELSEEDWGHAIENEHNKVDLASSSTSLVDFRDVEQKLEDLKKVERATKKESVRVSTVNSSGYIFQADESSLNFMATTILALDEGETVMWRLKDNSEVLVTRDSLREALRLGVKNRNLLMEEE